MCVVFISCIHGQPLNQSVLDQTAAHFGAQVFGSDIDGRQMRGRGNTSFSQFQKLIGNSVMKIDNQGSCEQPLNMVLLTGLSTFVLSM
jgi:hypothetical protein